MKVTRRDFVVGSIAASTMPMGGVSAAAISAPTLGVPSEIHSNLDHLYDLRKKANRAFVVEGRLDEIVHLRREALRRLGYSLGLEARTEDERRLFREAAAFLAKMEGNFCWLPWNQNARDRCALLRQWGEAGGQHRWLVAERMRQGGRGAEPVT